MARQIFSMLLITLMLLSGMAMFAPPAFAVWCYDPLLGDTAEFPGNDCPGGSTPVSSPAGDQASGGQITTFVGLLNHINTILNTVIPFLVGLAVFVIIYGVFGYIRHSADEEKRTEARLFIVWGVIGVFLMLSIWGLVNILVNTLPLKKTPVPVGSIFPTSK